MKVFLVALASMFLLPIAFTAYLLYGFIRPHVSRRFRQEIEDDEDDEPPPQDVPNHS